MIRDNSGYGLTMAMPCMSPTTPNIADMRDVVDEVSLMTFDFNSPSRSKQLVILNSPLESYPPSIDVTVQGLAESIY
jgi:GH18 family chitinase